MEEGFREEDKNKTRRQKPDEEISWMGENESEAVASGG